MEFFSEKNVWSFPGDKGGRPDINGGRLDFMTNHFFPKRNAVNAKYDDSIVSTSVTPFHSDFFSSDDNICAMRHKYGFSFRTQLHSA